MDIPAAGAHHIRAVVDHFLGAAPPAAPRSDADGPRGARLAVVAARHGAHAAWATAALARASLLAWADSPAPSRPRVVLEEWHRQPWSAEVFLGGSDHAHLAGLFRPPRFAGETRARRRWLGGVEVAPPRLAKRSPTPGAAPELAWLNFGLLTERSLAALEALRAWDEGGPPAGALDALVWCDDTAGLGALAAAYRLGRLVAALAPGRLLILAVARDAAARDGLDRPRGLAAAAAPGLPVACLAMAPGGGVRAVTAALGALACGPAVAGAGAGRVEARQAAEAGA